MDKNMSTTYVPLQPPYQVIKYGKDVAMQIGTLIVSVQEDKEEEGDDVLGYHIETHSHPVVSYGNKDKAPKDQALSKMWFLEGAVWNRVEVKDITTVCLTDSKLTWWEFNKVIWDDLQKQVNKKYESLILFSSINNLLRGGISLPEAKEYTIHLREFKNRYTSQKFIRSSEDDLLALNIIDEGDDDKIEASLMEQVTEYSLIIASKMHEINSNDSMPAIKFIGLNERCQSFADNFNRYISNGAIWH